MPRKSRIQEALPKITQYFDRAETKIYRSPDLASVFSEHRDEWKLPQSATVRGFVDFLTKEANLRRLDFPFPHRKEHRYVWGEVPLLEVVQTLKPDSYFSHYTAMRVRGLTQQIPKTIYLNHEQPARPQNRSLTQHAIDAAFARRPRVTSNFISFGDVRITLVNGMQTERLGVVQETVTYDSSEAVSISVTGLERTLIDITVRPIYAGGVNEVQKAYRLAKGKVSIERLTAMLQKLNYVYPYHQAIGFYLERAGFEESALKLLRQFPIEFDFYLSNQMGDKDFVKSWRLFIPKGF
jgi:hypothetical protein